VWVVFFSFCFLDFSCRCAFITLTYNTNKLFFFFNIPFLVFKFSIEGLRDILGVASTLKLASPS